MGTGSTPSAVALATPSHLPLRGTNTEEECHGHWRLRQLTRLRKLLFIRVQRHAGVDITG
ncbi:MAG TPA: hypothetical protein EYQ03_06415 [Nitrospinaceae bacterium]|nr:hypothetical protein [Nitrospinaceae bacterium]